jgi:hypothetical protein
LRGHEHPGHGGWGGRAHRVDDGPDTWETRGALDTRDDGSTPEEFSVTRWFADAQNDFAARLQWSIEPVFEGANHAPVITVEQVDLEVQAGQRVELSAAVRDPDGDVVSCRWWQYREAGSYGGEVQLTTDDSADGVTSAVVDVPADATSGQTIHVIVEAVDDGTPTLKGYQRIILTVV